MIRRFVYRIKMKMRCNIGNRDRSIAIFEVFRVARKKCDVIIDKSQEPIQKIPAFNWMKYYAISISDVINKGTGFI